MVGNNFVAYAYDLLVVIERDSRQELEVKDQELANLISNWFRSVKLELSVQKIERIVFKCGMINRSPEA